MEKPNNANAVNATDTAVTLPAPNRKVMRSDSSADTMVLTNLLFLSVGCSAVAYLLWSLCVRHLGAVTANNYMYLQAVVTMIAAYFIVNEPITAIGIIGCALVIGGLWIGEKLNRRPN